MSLLREKAELLRVLGHPTRLAIVRELGKGPKCVTDIQELVEAPQANVSQHLTALRASRVVDFHEDGKLRCYYIARPELGKLVVQFLSAECEVIERSAEEVRRMAKRREKQACRVDQNKGNG